jgi:hypothetical protein
MSGHAGRLPRPRIVAPFSMILFLPVWKLSNRFRQILLAQHALAFDGEGLFPSADLGPYLPSHRLVLREDQQIAARRGIDRRHPPRPSRSRNVCDSGPGRGGRCRVLGTVLRRHQFLFAVGMALDDDFQHACPAVDHRSAQPEE